jgi:hypothetical protein
MFKKRIRFDDFVSSIRWSFFEKLKVGLNMPKINEITTEEALNKVLSSDDALDFADSISSNVSFALDINDYMYELFYCVLLWEFDSLYPKETIHNKIEPMIDYRTIENILGEIGISIKSMEGGGEGGAESCHSIFALGDKLYKIRYSYYSYIGYEIDDDAELIEVIPKMIEVVSYVEA